MRACYVSVRVLVCLTNEFECVSHRSGHVSAARRTPVIKHAIRAKWIRCATYTHYRPHLSGTISKDDTEARSAITWDNDERPHDDRPQHDVNIITHEKKVALNLNKWIWRILQNTFWTRASLIRYSMHRRISQQWRIRVVFTFFLKPPSVLYICRCWQEDCQSSDIFLASYSAYKRLSEYIIL